jgi:hypothetical protein
LSVRQRSIGVRRIAAARTQLIEGTISLVKAIEGHKHRTLLGQCSADLPAKLSFLRFAKPLDDSPVIYKRILTSM